MNWFTIIPGARDIEWIHIYIYTLYVLTPYSTIWFVTIVTRTRKPLALCLCVSLYVSFGYLFLLCFLSLACFLCLSFRCVNAPLEVNWFTYRLFTVWNNIEIVLFRIFLRDFFDCSKVNQKELLATPRDNNNHIKTERQKK